LVLRQDVHEPVAHVVAVLEEQALARVRALHHVDDLRVLGELRHWPASAPAAPPPRDGRATSPVPAATRPPPPSPSAPRRRPPAPALPCPCRRSHPGAASAAAARCTAPASTAAASCSGGRPRWSRRRRTFWSPRSTVDSRSISSSHYPTHPHPTRA